MYNVRKPALNRVLSLACDWLFIDHAPNRGFELQSTRVNKIYSFYRSLTYQRQYETHLPLQYSESRKNVLIRSFAQFTRLGCQLITRQPWFCQTNETKWIAPNTDLFDML